MKDAMNIDELLNGYLDEELTQRQMTEVQRLIANDEGVAMRLRELQRVRLLVGSLPFAEAPGHMLADIRARLERSSLLEAQPQVAERRQGSRGLLARKVLSLAAMIALVGGLAAVVVMVVTPEQNTERMVVVQEQPSPDTPGGGETTVVAPAVTEGSLKGRLELRTGTFLAAEALVSDAIEERGLQEKSTSEVTDNAAAYAVKCSRSELTLLLSDLADIWPRFESASLYVESDEDAGGTWVDRVKPSQVMEIVGQPSNERTIKAAKWFAIRNGMTYPLQDNRAVASDGGIGIPKPTETGDNVRDRRGDTGFDRLIEFTIVVTAAD